MIFTKRMTLLFLFLYSKLNIKPIIVIDGINSSVTIPYAIRNLSPEIVKSGNLTLAY